MQQFIGKSLELVKKAVQLSFLLVLFFFHTSFAQETASENAAPGQAEVADPVKLRAAALKENEGLIERKAKTHLQSVVDDFVSRRLQRHLFNISLEVGANKRKIADWAQTFNDTELTTLRAELQSRDYEGLREFLQDVTIKIGFSSRVSEAEWRPIVNALQAQFEGSGTAVETVEGNTENLSNTIEEKNLQLSLQEARNALERQSVLRKEEITTEKKLELENSLKIQKSVEEGLQRDLQVERNKREEIADQIFSDKNLKERIVKEWPSLSRFLFSGLGIGALLLVASVIVGMLVLLGIRSLGGSFVLGSEGIAEALKAGKETILLPKKLENIEEEDKKEPDALKEDALIDFDAKPEFKEAAEQLRAQVLRDIPTTGAILSRVAEQEKSGEVVAIFDLLGPDLAQLVFDNFTSSAKRTMQRAFFNGQIKRVAVNTLFNRVNELRTMLSTTDVLMREKTDKTFAQIAISFSEDEIANALKDVKAADASKVLSIFPPDRMVKILRLMTSAVSKDIFLKIGKAVTDGAKLSVEVIESLASNLMDENKVKYEEQKRYFKSLLTASSEDEAELIAKGLEFNPRLLLDVIGIRAVIEDFWSQATETVDSLLSLVELEQAAFLLFIAPEKVKVAVLNSFPERKRVLTEDAMDNFKRNEEMRLAAEKILPTSKKIVLGRLTELAQQGTVTLPSYERLKDMAAEQALQEKNAQVAELKTA